MSSTTRIFALPLLSTVIPSAVILHGLDEFHNVHRLRDVAVEAGIQEPLTIPMHRLCRQRHDRDRCRTFVCAQAAERLDAVDARQLDVHQHQIRFVFGSELERPLRVRRLEQSITRRLQDVAEELHVLLVVLDHEDLRTVHVRAVPDGSVNANVLPLPGSLSTQMRPPCNSTSRLDSASPRPVPSRWWAPASVCWNSSKIRS